MKTFVAILVLVTSSQIAHAESAAEHVKAAQVAFDRGDYKVALARYSKAFALESSPLNAARVFIASAYSESPTLTVERFEVWLLKKKEDATKAGDREDSWTKVDGILSSMKSAASRQEETVSKLSARIRELEQKVHQQTIVVDKLKADSAFELAKVRELYEKQLGNLLRQDQLRPDTMR